MRLIDVYDLTRAGKRVQVDNIELEKKEEQITELIDKLLDDESVSSVKILTYPEKILKELAGNSDGSVAASATLTLMNLRLPEFELYKYV